MAGTRQERSRSFLAVGAVATVGMLLLCSTLLAKFAAREPEEFDSGDPTVLVFKTEEESSPPLKPWSDANEEAAAFITGSQMPPGTKLFHAPPVEEHGRHPAPARSGSDESRAYNPLLKAAASAKDLENTEHDQGVGMYMQIRKFQSAHQDQVRDKRLKLQRQKILAADGKTGDTSKGEETPTNKLSFPVSYFSGWYDNNGEWQDEDVGYWGHHKNIVSDHLHNEEFEDMLNQCKGSTTCSALLGKEFWWLYDQPWRKCSETTDWACIPYYCPSNQEGSTSCKPLQGNSLQALVGHDVRCWDTGRSLWQFSMTREGCQDHLPWRGGTGWAENLRIGYNCHGCNETHDGCPGEPDLDDDNTCSYHWTECAPGSGPGEDRVGKNWGGSGELGQNEWLSSHVVQCPEWKYLSEWRVSRERCQAGHLRIHYRCCEQYWGPCRTASTTGSDAAFADGFEGHNVQCDGARESLTHFQWTGSNFKYTCCCENNCCDEAFGGGRGRSNAPYWPYGYRKPLHPPEQDAQLEPPQPHSGQEGQVVLGTDIARPPTDDSTWFRDRQDTVEHGGGVPGQGDEAWERGWDGRGVAWKADPLSQLQYLSEHLDGAAGTK